MAQTFSNAVGIPMIAVAQGVCGYLSFLIAGVNEAGFWVLFVVFPPLYLLLAPALFGRQLPLSLITDNVWQGIFVAVWGLLILGTMDNVIRFLLAKRMADVHPIVTVLGVIL